MYVQWTKAEHFTSKRTKKRKGLSLRTHPLLVLANSDGVSGKKIIAFLPSSVLSLLNELPSRPMIIASMAIITPATIFVDVSISLQTLNKFAEQITLSLCTFAALLHVIVRQFYDGGCQVTCKNTNPYIASVDSM